MIVLMMMMTIVLLDVQYALTNMIQTINGDGLSPTVLVCTFTFLCLPVVKVIGYILLCLFDIGVAAVYRSSSGINWVAYLALQSET